MSGTIRLTLRPTSSLENSDEGIHGVPVRRRVTLLHRPDRLEGVPAHAEQAFFAQHLEDLRLLVPLRRAVDAEELVERSVAHLRILRQQLPVVLPARHGLCEFFL